MGSKGRRPMREVDNLAAICQSIVWNKWESRLLTDLYISTASYWDSFTFYM
jgi:hypothetical protein